MRLFAASFFGKQIESDPGDTLDLAFGKGAPINPVYIVAIQVCCNSDIHDLMASWCMFIELPDLTRTRIVNRRTKLAGIKPILFIYYQTE